MSAPGGPRCPSKQPENRSDHDMQPSGMAAHAQSADRQSSTSPDARGNHSPFGEAEGIDSGSL